METTGKGNEGLMILVVLGLVTFVFVVLVGGPTEAISIVNSAGRDVVEVLASVF